MWSEGLRFLEESLLEKPRQNPLIALWANGTFAGAVFFDATDV